MKTEEYVKERLQDQIDWYDQKSSKNQKSFKRLQIISIVASITIPFLSGTMWGDTVTLRVMVGLLGLTVATITGLQGLYKFQENWLQYRTTCESLKHQKYLFLTNTEPYNAEGAFELLVSRVESLISRENSSWNQYMSLEKKKE